MELRLHLLPLILLLGATLYLTLSEAWLLRNEARERVQPWAFGWAVASAFFLVARILQRATTRADVADVAVRLQYVAALGVGFIAFGAFGVLAPKTVSRASRFAVGTAAVAMSVIVFATPWVIGGESAWRTDVFGARWLAPERGPFAWLIAAYLALVGLWIVRQTWVAQRRHRLPRSFTWAAIAFLAAAANDVALSTGRVRTTQLLEYGFFAVAIAMAHYRALRVGAARADLEHEVARRTADLAESRTRAETALAELERSVAELRVMQQKLMQTDRLASMGLLAAGTAHEINNPLAYVSANIQLADEELAALPGADGRVAHVRAQLRDALGGVERMRRIVRDLGTLARAEESDTRPVDLRAVLETSLDLAGVELRKRARVERAFEDVPPVRGGEGRLGQVFINLLANAAQALPPDRADENVVRVALRRAGDRVAVEVSDTGEGIDASVLDRIFDPFFTTKGVGKGTGLGLSICQGIVASLGGTIEVASERGRGSTFRVLLPVAEETAATSRRRALGSGADIERRSGVIGRVLIVDDEPQIARALARALRHHEVVIAPGGVEALRLLAERRYDVILCDLSMPEMSGPQLFEELRRRHPGAERRVIFVTGGAVAEELQSFLASVPNRCIDKPVDVNVLRALVEDAVTGGAVAQEA